jgi:hypothetical protein
MGETMNDRDGKNHLRNHLSAAGKKISQLQKELAVEKCRAADSVAGERFWKAQCSRLTGMTIPELDQYLSKNIVTEIKGDERNDE